jgi:predicted peptidase
MKYKVTIIIFLFSIISIAQSEVRGRIKTEIIAKKEIAYVLNIPKNTTEKKPLIIFLHCSGEKGTDIEKVKTHGP